MADRHVNPSRRPAMSVDEMLESMRHRITENLAIDADRLRHAIPASCHVSALPATGRRFVTAASGRTRRGRSVVHYV